MGLGDFDSSQTSVEYGESLLASQQERKRKEKRAARRDRKWEYGIAAISVADQFMAKKANKQVDDLKQSMAADLIVRKSDFADKMKFEELYDNIKGDAFNPNDEESYAQYFYDLALADYTAANTRDKIHINKDSWIDKKTASYIYDWKDSLKTWKPQLRATVEEFTLPIEQYYADQIKEVLSPSNTSSIRKVLEKFGLMDKKEIQSAFTIGQYTGALANTKNAKEAYELAMKNTNARLARLREGSVDQEGRPQLPTLEAVILTSKDVDRELKKKIDFAVNVDTSGIFYFENMPLTQGALEKGASDQQIGRNELLGELTTTDSEDPDKQGSIFAKVFYSHAKDLGWTDEQFSAWLIKHNGEDGNTFQSLLVHPFTGPSSARDLKEVVLPLDMGGVYPSIGAVEYFQDVWARNAQNIYDIEKQFERGLKLTEGADPALWQDYMLEGFKMTIENNLKLLDDGRLLIVPNNNEITMIERLGPKISQRGEETVVEEATGDTVVTEERTEEQRYDILNKLEAYPEEDRNAITQIVENGVIATFETEIPLAYQKGQLGEIQSMRDRFIQMFPEDQSEITSTYNSFLESVLGDKENEDTLRAEEAESNLPPREKIEDLLERGIAVGIDKTATAWNNRLVKEAKENVQRLLALDSLQDYQQKQLTRSLKRLNIDPNSSREDIFLALQEESIGEEIIAGK